MDARFWGVVLICVGLMAAVSQLGYVSGDLFLLFVSAALLAGYLLSGYATGLLVAGMSVGALGSFVAISDRYPATGAWLFFLLMGGGFLLVLLIERLLGRSIDWPVYPGAALVAFSGFIYVRERGCIAVSVSYWRYWPILLVGIGLIMVLASFLRPTRQG